jgi:hypothetical protein
MRKENIHLSMHNTVFEIDKLSSSLIDVCNPKNSIGLKCFQRFDEDYLWLPYGLESKNLSIKPSDETEEWQARMLLPKKVLEPGFEASDEEIQRLNRDLCRRDPNIHVMNYGLPIYKIDGTKFIVDLRNNRLCKLGSSDQELFFRDMIYRDSGYLCKVERNWIGKYNGHNEFGQLYIEVPHKAILDPKTMARLTDRQLREIKGKTDFELVVNQNDYHERRKSVLPRVDINGKVYRFDGETGLFSAKGSALPALDAQRFVLHKFEPTMSAYFDTKDNCLVDLDFRNLTQMPADVIRITLPIPFVIDGYGAAKRNGFEVKDTLMRYPTQTFFIAKIIPLEETAVGELFRKAGRSRDDIKANKTGIKKSSQPNQQQKNCGINRK